VHASVFGDVQRRHVENRANLIARLNALDVSLDADERGIGLDFLDVSGSNLFAASKDDDFLTFGKARARALIDVGLLVGRVEDRAGWQGLALHSLN